MMGIMTTEGDQLSTFRAQLRARREGLGLTLAEAARRAGGGISPQRWGHIEAGYERRQDVEIPARPRRATIIKMARALQWAPDDALRAAGEIPLTPVEAARASHRDELEAVLDTLPEHHVALLLCLARALLDPRAPVSPSAAGEGSSPVSVEVRPLREGTAARRRARTRERPPEPAS